MSTPRYFPTTEWSMILSIQEEPSVGIDKHSLEKFYRDYWPPVASFLQSLGLSNEDSEDLTQEIFAKIHLKNQIFDIDPAKGRMRNYLMTIAKRQAQDFLRMQSTQKRGANAIHLPLEDSTIHLTDSTDHEKAFDRSWALQLVELTSETLKQEYASRDRLEWFNVLFAKITVPDKDNTYADLASELKTTEAAIRTAIHRMRQKYQKILRREVAKTVATPDEIDSELRALFHALEQFS